jgi:hypothetical protein
MTNTFAQGDTKKLFEAAKFSSAITSLRIKCQRCCSCLEDNSVDGFLIEWFLQYNAEASYLALIVEFGDTYVNFVGDAFQGTQYCLGGDIRRLLVPEFLVEELLLQIRTAAKGIRQVWVCAEGRLQRFADRGWSWGRGWSWSHGWNWGRGRRFRFASSSSLTLKSTSASSKREEGVQS